MKRSQREKSRKVKRKENAYVTEAEDGKHSLFFNCELEGVVQVLFPLWVLGKNRDRFGFLVNRHPKVFLEVSLQFN